MASLPTREEMFQHALAELDKADAALAGALDWLRSDWRPVGSTLTSARSPWRRERSTGRRDGPSNE